MVLISVDWKNIHGNHFNGSTFTAPVKGTYLFDVSNGIQEFIVNGSLTSCSTINLFVNGVNDTQQAADSLKRAFTDKYKSPGDDGCSVHLQRFDFACRKTLNAKDRVCVKLIGTFYSLDDPTKNYFEGRLISTIEE